MESRARELEEVEEEEEEEMAKRSKEHNVVNPRSPLADTGFVGSSSPLPTYAFRIPWVVYSSYRMPRVT